MQRILLALDTDDQASVFDAVVAVDAGVEVLLRHSGVKPADVRELVYGCIFTRAAEHLRHTAIFIGGRDVAAGEAVLKTVTDTFFANMRTSVMLDSNGANTTAAAAVLAARRHVGLRGSVATVLAGTGPVGRRVVRLLAGEGASVRVGSRKLVHAEATCDKVAHALGAVDLTPWAMDSADAAIAALEGSQLVVACGPPGVQLLPAGALAKAPSIQAAIDLNAVPPWGIADVKTNDKGASSGSAACYGAIGVGGTKMRIHKAAIAKLFTVNNLVLDAEEIYALGKEIDR